MRRIIWILLIIICGWIIFLVPFTPIWRRLPLYKIPVAQKFPVLIDSKVILYFPDFPLFWWKISEHQIGHSAYENLYPYLYKIELVVRKSFGIRPTPSRWDFWLGKSSVVCLSPDSKNWAVVTKPRVYSRILLPLLLGKEIKLTDGFKIQILQIDDYLIFSNSEDCEYKLRYLEFLSSDNRDCLLAIASGRSSAELGIFVDDRITFSGSIMSSYVFRRSEFPPLDISSCAFSISGEFIEIFRDTGREVFDWMRPSIESTMFYIPIEVYLKTVRTTPLEKMFTKLFKLVINNNGYVCLLNISEEFSNPVPVIAGWIPLEGTNFSKVKELLDLSENILIYPYRWRETEGFIIPLWGRAYQLCLAKYKNGFIFTSNESAMNHLITSIKEDVNSPNQLSINFNSIAEEYKKLCSWVITYEFIPFFSERDFTEMYPAWEKFFSDLGKLEINTIKDAYLGKIWLRGHIGK